MLFRHTRMAARRGLFAFATFALTVTACSGAEKPGVEASSEHIFAHPQSGVGLELPAIWADRYRVADTITAPAAGLERELSFRLIRADSSLVAEPLLVVRVFANAGIDTVPPNEIGARWGTVVAKDAARTVVVRPAPGNPLAAGQPDAQSFDALIIALLGRPMKASLRAGER